MALALARVGHPLGPNLQMLLGHLFKCHLGHLSKCQHQFWECLVARPVTLQVVAGPDSLQSFWLLQAPSQALHHMIRSVVCLPALSAMDYGRADLYHHAVHLPPGPSPDRLLIVYKAGSRVDHFWELLPYFPFLL